MVSWPFSSSSSSKQQQQPPARELVVGPQTTSQPTASSPTAFDNSSSSSSSIQTGKPTIAINRVGQIAKHLDNSLPSTLRYEMSSQEFKQAPHKLLVIPGPIEVSDDVLLANAHPSMSHVSPDFVPVLGDCIRMIKTLLFAPDSQPVITAGSGTLGWDHVASNVIEPGQDALVLNSGYFGDSFAECLTTYGAKVDQIKAPIGSKPSLQEVEKALQSKKYKVVTFTHVDTSTGVLSDAKGLGELIKRVSPESILVLDGVCSVASEEIRMAEWGIDVVLTASQKGLGCPPGLMVLAASPKAIKAFESRKNTSKQLLCKLGKMDTRYESIRSRFKQHIAASDRVKNFVKELGLEQLVADGIKDGAHGMTAVKYPQGVKATDLLPKMVARNIVVAAGLHKEVKDTYFRIGHMGVTVTHDKERGDIDHLLKSLKEALTEAGYKGKA
ncbi:hypothetical protein L7F22_037264 [Adiantum nelumboides]|nr:hypothetical protein [Adiantum nelumboides]